MKRRGACAWIVYVLAACSGSAGTGASRDASVPRHDSGSPSADAGGANRRADAATTGQASALTREQLLDPMSCAGCHPNHYREWSSSMHAYAAKDPVFVAMNKRGQRETHGALGTFCITCHAPLAALDGRSTDGLNLDALPDKDWGVSCYFCHNAKSVTGDHDAMLELGNDTTLRGEITDPAEPGAHVAGYSPLFEDTKRDSTAMCGGCHDIVNSNGVHLERTYEEYESGLFAMSAAGQGPDSPALESCPSCHMPTRSELAAVIPEGGQVRTVHEHLWPGVDVPLTDAPNRDALRSAIEDCELGTASIGYFTLQVAPPSSFNFDLETNAGHNQPSGAAQDRRMWLEFLAYDASGALIDQASSGNIGDGELEEKPDGDPMHDPNLLLFRDRIYDGSAEPVHMFWQAASSSAHPNGYESNVLPVRTASLDVGTHGIQKQYRAAGPDGLPARITARLRIRPIGIDVLEDLVASGDLDPAIVAQMPTFSFGAQLEWTQADGMMKVISATPKSDCKTYRCLLFPNATACN